MFPSRTCVYLLLAGAAVPRLINADEAPLLNKVIATNADDRLNSIPTTAFTIAHQSLQDASNTVATRNARIVDLSLEQTTPTYAFTVTYVDNSGPYYKPWLWYAGLDAAGLASAINSYNARLTVLKAYDAGGGQIRYLAVMIGNAGKDSRGWWYYTDMQPAQIAAALSANNARLVQISSFLSGGTLHYAVVMVALGAKDAVSWWYTDLPVDQITALMAGNNARLIDLDYNPSDGNYNAIMVDCSGGCPAWWWNTGQTADQMQADAKQNGARIIDSSSYPGCDGFCYSYLMVDNTLPALDSANAISSRVAGLLQAGGINGVQGLYLKQVGGPVLANMEESFVYEPASSIKVLAHLYAMTQVQNGAATLADPVQNYTNGPTSCPDPAQLGGMETLANALNFMMWNSDNARTREVTDLFGDASINSFAGSIGMSNTAINHIIGCGGPVPDQLTLTDAAALYEGVASGALLTPPAQATFYSLMAGKAQFQAVGYDFTHLWDSDIPAMIAQAAPGASAAQVGTFMSQMNLAYKAGSYTICEDSCAHVSEYFSISGWVEIPFCSSGSTTVQDYVFGLFLHGATDRSWSPGKVTLTSQNFTAAKSELLREQIVAGLTSCGLTP